MVCNYCVTFLLYYIRIRDTHYIILIAGYPDTDMSFYATLYHSYHFMLQCVEIYVVVCYILWCAAVCYILSHEVNSCH